MSTDDDTPTAPRDPGSGQTGTGAAKAAPPDLSGLADTSKYAIAAIGVLSAAAGILGGFTGGIARVARNDPDVLPLVVILVFVAAGLGVVALIMTRIGPGTRRARQLITAAIVASLAMFGAATYLTTRALSASLATPDRPIVTAKWVQPNGVLSLSGTVSASGLRFGDQLTVVAVRVFDRGDPGPPTDRTKRAEWTPTPHFVEPGGIVYEQTAGADMDGKASITFEVPLPAGYDGMQVVASTGDLLGCPSQRASDVTGSGEDAGGTATPTSVQTAVAPAPSQEQPASTAGYACLTLDAPESTPTTATSRSVSTP